MAESLYIVNLGLQNPDGMSTPRYKIHALKVIEEQMVGRLSRSCGIFRRGRFAKY